MPCDCIFNIYGKILLRIVGERGGGAFTPLIFSNLLNSAFGELVFLELLEMLLISCHAIVFLIYTARFYWEVLENGGGGGVPSINV
jgi:hypothetical protein